jgi:hypothetical protein
LPQREASDLHTLTSAMRDHDEEDPKKPQPVRVPGKGINAAEAAEAAPWLPLRKDDDRDRHRHVV